MNGTSIIDAYFDSTIKKAGPFTTVSDLIVNNDTALNNYNKKDPSAPDGGGHIVNAHNNIFWNNGNVVSMLNAGTLTADHSNFGTFQWPGTGNTSANPFFVNTALGDYRLDRDSTSRGAGRGEMDMGASFPVGAPMAMSHPFVHGIELRGDDTVVQFWADSGVDYQLQTSSTVSGDSWQTVFEVPRHSMPRFVEIQTPRGDRGQVFFRVVSVP